MPDAFGSLSFSGSWRPYQARVLAELDAHLDDERVHVVAPPGSGKTLLGLEAVRRMGRPALILAPTLALRDQWLDRFAEHYAGAPISVSTDLRQPGVLTATTYQALHVAHKANALAGLAEAGIGTIVVDEAHHLRNAWWRTLRALRDGLAGVRVIALTATPPYDVPPAEWSRYEAFCGPPDAEISTPELVRAGHLCPHLDAVHLSLPAPADQDDIHAHRARAEAFAERFLGGPWMDTLAQHPWLRQPDAHADAIVDEAPEWFVGALAVLRASGRDVQAAAAVLNLAAEHLPPARLSLLSRVLDGVLGEQKRVFAGLAGESQVRELGADLNRMGARLGSRTLLHQPPAVRKALGRSASKMESVAEVVAFEAEHRGAGLRAVVLADRIHEEAWAEAHDRQPRLGVAPLVSRLRGLAGPAVGAVTGRFAAVPEEVLPALLREAEGLELTVEPIASEPGLMRVSCSNAGLAGPMTRLFERGEIRVLVGTVALLGEGWDAPAANVLVMASYAATFVQTGQMRGRVLRTDLASPLKVSAIWHLACVEPGAENGGPDLSTLRRRFAAFAGPREGRAGGAPTLETGMARLALPAPPFSPREVEEANARAYASVVSLEHVRNLWRASTGSGADGRQLRPTLRVPSSQDPLPSTLRVRPPAWTERFPAGWVGGTGALALASLGGTLSGLAAPFVLALWLTTAGFGGLAAGITASRVAQRRRYARDLGAYGLRLWTVGEVVLAALRESGQIRSEKAQVWIGREGGVLDARIDGATVPEGDVFAAALAEAVSEIRSPRYLLRCESAFVAVPTVLGVRKARAETFARAWREKIGPAELVFTRTPPGRRVLAEARARRAWTEHEVERVRTWA